MKTVLILAGSMLVLASAGSAAPLCTTDCGTEINFNNFGLISTIPSIDVNAFGDGLEFSSRALSLTTKQSLEMAVSLAVPTLGANVLITDIDLSGNGNAFTDGFSASITSFPLPKRADAHTV